MDGDARQDGKNAPPSRLRFESVTSPSSLINSNVPINATKHHEANSPTPGLLIKCVSAPAARAARRAAYATRYDRVNPGSELRWLLNMIIIFFFICDALHGTMCKLCFQTAVIESRWWFDGAFRLNQSWAHAAFICFGSLTAKATTNVAALNQTCTSPTRMTAPVPQSCKQPHLTSRWGGLETVLSADVDQQRCANAHPELKVHKSDKHPI